MALPEPIPFAGPPPVGRDAFERLVAEHSDAVWRLALRLAPNRIDAEDLYQEAFLRAWRGIGRFRGEARFGTWITRILVNIAVDRIRRAPPPPAAPPAPRAVDPADGLACRDLLGRVLSAVAELPRRQRESLLLRARGGLSVAEIARTMKIRPAAVKSHLVAARKKLVAKFGREAAEWGLA